MNRYCFEQYLIDNCSPTLASLKTANLFNYRYSSTDELNKAVERWNKELSGKGITVTVLRKRENTALIYVYRAKRLAKDFSRPGVERFMKCHGYENTDIDLCLEVLWRQAGEKQFISARDRAVLRLSARRCYRIY